MKRRILSLFFVLTLLLAPLFAARPARAAAGETLDLLNVRQNQRGEGYEWANRTDTLTLRGLRIETDDRYGIRIKDGATVVLEGDNYIKASYAALDIEGSATFTGTGSLTLVAGEIGFLNPAGAKNHRVNLTGGTYRITAPRGIVSERAEWSLTGGSLTVDATESAIEGRSVKILGGSLTANAPLRASNDLKISYAALELSASSPVLVSEKSLSLSGLLTKDGKTIASAADYAGENVLSAVPAKRGRTTSLLFGGTVPIYVDYLIFGAAALTVAAIIAVPRMRKKKSLQAARERYAAEQAAKEQKQKKEENGRDR
ncbi:MAG: hypothetical protein II192_01660 [Clostridia bacterium]|nr:hypothetical protein [Clostridia bacterium]